MKKIFTLILTVIMAVACCLGLTACGEEETTLADGKLTIGYTIYAPMNYFDENNDNKFVGFDTELAEAFCKIIGVEADFVEIEWDNKFTDLKSKNIDCIWNGMTITEEAKEKCAVSAAYLENKQVVVCKAENASKYTDINSLSNAASIAYEKGSAGNSVATDLGLDSKGVEVTAQKDALMEVASGASEIALIDITMARVLTGEGTSYENLVFVDVGCEVEEFGVAFRKADEGLAKAFDIFVATCQMTGEYDMLMAKYFA